MPVQNRIDVTAQPPLVLIIAPQGPLLDAFARDLREAGCRVQTAIDGATGERTAAAAQPDVVVMSQELPDADSLDVCRRIRNCSASNQAPVFLVTSQRSGSASSKEAPVDRLAWGLGTWLRWNDAHSERLVQGDLVIDARRHRATIDNRDLNLTPTEFRLLATFAREAGRVFSRQELCEACRGGHARLQVRTIDVHIKSIRQKLHDRSDLIETVHGVGYRMQEAPSRPLRQPGCP